jgi:peptidoglycan/LPS O-acetylase OafA/YrhL
MQNASLRTSSARIIPTLDGWRGVAIALVLVDHVQHAFLGGNYWAPWTQTGLHGVTIFFVLSGFLITTKLLQESGNLKKFYLRRIFRLSPAVLAYLGALALLSIWLGRPFVRGPEVVACLAFYRNFVSNTNWGLTGHFWSLSIEEQFYLVWPCALLFIGRKLSFWVVAIATALLAAYRLGVWQQYAQTPFALQTEFRADALMVGCLLALALADQRIQSRAIRYARVLQMPAFLTLTFAVYRFHFFVPLFESIAIACLIAFTVLNPATSVAKMLSSRWPAWLGAVSYSVYIWHPLFLSFPHVVLPYSVFMIPIFALGSYYLIEKPFIRLGHRLTAQSPARSIGSQVAKSPKAPRSIEMIESQGQTVDIDASSRNALQTGAGN